MRILVAILLLGATATFLPVQSWGQGLAEGRDYIVLRPAVPSGNPNAIVVTEFFSYQCPHCFAFSRPFASWASRQPADVVCRREAVSIGHAAWDASARAFYTLRVLDQLERLDTDIFNAIHREGAPFTTENAIAEWLSGRGIAPNEFHGKYRTFEVERNFRQAQQLAIAHKLPSVPAIAIDGKYLVAIASNRDFSKQLATVSLLIEKVRAEKLARR